MTERIHYDDDPADTAATKWLKTRSGLSAVNTVRFCPSGASAKDIIHRVFRTAYLLGQQSRLDD